jgi:hypothetical protein
VWHVAERFSLPQRAGPQALIGLLVVAFSKISQAMEQKQ